MVHTEDSGQEIALEEQIEGHDSQSFEEHEEQLDIVRATVDITKEAARAISITALEAMRESALFMGVIGSRGELLDPFSHIDAAIWTEPEIPKNMVDASYDFCEELTRREAGNFYHSFKYLPEEKRRSIMAYYAFCRRADDIADGDFVDIFPGGSSDDPESVNYRSKIERLSPGVPVLDRSTYNDKMSQLFYYRKKLSTAYGSVTSTDPIFIALKDTVRRFGIQRRASVRRRWRGILIGSVLLPGVLMDSPWRRVVVTGP